jgi:hypothetical protein
MSNLAEYERMINRVLFADAKKGTSIREAYAQRESKQAIEHELRASRPTQTQKKWRP